MIKFNKIDNARRLNFNGSFVQIPKSKWGYLRKFKIYGESTQEADPTPTDPKDIKSVASTINVTACGENLAKNVLIDIAQHGVNFSFNPITNAYKIEGTSDVGTYPFKTFSMISKGFSGKTITIFKSGNTNSPSLRVHDRQGSLGNVADLSFSNKIIVVTLPELTNDLDVEFVCVPSTYYNSEQYVQILLGSYTLETIPPFTSFTGSTTAITFRDTNGNLHYPSSLPAGTADEINIDKKSFDRVKRLVVTSGTTSEPNNIAAEFFSVSDILCGVYWRDAANKFAETLSEQNNIYSSHFKAGTPYRRAPYEMLYNNNKSTFDTQIIAYLYKTDITNAGFTLDNIGARSYIDKVIADTGQPIIFDYPLATPIPWTLHPDEQKKIITVDDTVCNVFTDSEVQPEMEFNAISYGE